MSLEPPTGVAQEAATLPASQAPLSRTRAATPPPVSHSRQPFRDTPFQAAQAAKSPTPPAGAERCRTVRLLRNGATCDPAASSAASATSPRRSTSCRLATRVLVILAAFFAVVAGLVCEDGHIFSTDFLTHVAARLAEAAPAQWAEWLSAKEEGQKVHDPVQDLAAHFDSHFAEIDERLNERFNREESPGSAAQPSVPTFSGQVENVHNSQFQSAGNFEIQYRQLVATLEQTRRGELLAQQQHIERIIQVAETRFAELLARVAELEGETVHTIKTRVADAITQHSTVAAADRAKRQAAIPEVQLSLQANAHLPPAPPLTSLSESNSERCFIADPSLLPHRREDEAVLGVELESVRCLMQSFESALAQDDLDVNAISSPASPRAVTMWRYQPPNGLKMRLRAEPSVHGKVTDNYLEAGATFVVAEETTRAAAPGIRFLHLADGRGWAFDGTPDQGVMCVRAGDSSGDGLATA